MASTFFPVDNTAIIAAASVVSITVTVLGGFWKIINWLRDKFNEVENHLTALLNTHEDKDQHRHEDNIQRFAILETQLHTLIKNGKH